MRGYFTVFILSFFYFNVFAQANDEIPTIRVGYEYDFDRIRFPGQSYSKKPVNKKLPFPNGVKIEPPFRKNYAQESKDRKDFKTFRELLEYYFEWDKYEMQLYLIWYKSNDRQARIAHTSMCFPDQTTFIELNKNITTEIMDDCKSQVFLVQFWDVNNQCPYFEFTFK